MPRSVDSFTLAEMQNYRGTNPCPPDFDAFWQRGLDELATIDPQVEIVPADFSSSFARCDHLYFTSTKGARIHAKLLRPKQVAEPGAAVLMFHGYSSSSGDWVSKLPYVAEGMTVAALDVRGQGGLSQDPGGTSGWTHAGQFVRGLDDAPDDLFFRQVYLDTAQLVRVVSALPEVDGARLGTMGASQGGALSLACAALSPQIKRAAIVYPFLSDFQRVWALNLDARAYSELRDYFRKFDPLHERETAVFEKLGYIDIQHLAARMAAAVYFALTMMDEVCPPSSQFAAYNKIQSPKQLALYYDFAHEAIPGNEDAIFQFLRQL